MTIKEKIEAIKAVQDYTFEIEGKLERIIKETFDYHCDSIDSFTVGDDELEVRYWYSCRGEHGNGGASVPIEWLDDGFDYVSAYEEMKRKSEEKRKKEEKREKIRKEVERKASEARREKREYETYLKLKRKYES